MGRKNRTPKPKPSEYVEEGKKKEEAAKEQEKGGKGSKNAANKLPLSSAVGPSPSHTRSGTSFGKGGNMYEKLTSEGTSPEHYLREKTSEKSKASSSSSSGSSSEGRGREAALLRTPNGFGSASPLYSRNPDVSKSAVSLANNFASPRGMNPQQYVATSGIAHTQQTPSPGAVNTGGSISRSPGSTASSGSERARAPTPVYGGPGEASALSSLDSPGNYSSDTVMTMGMYAQAKALRKLEKEYAKKANVANPLPNNDTDDEERAPSNANPPGNVNTSATTSTGVGSSWMNSVSNLFGWGGSDDAANEGGAGGGAGAGGAGGGGEAPGGGGAGGEEGPGPGEEPGAGGGGGEPPDNPAANVAGKPEPPMSGSPPKASGEAKTPEETAALKPKNIPPPPAGITGGTTAGANAAAGVAAALNPQQENTSREGQGEFVPPPYGNGSAFAEKAREGDSDRLDPITPATGAKQTPATANSLIGADPIIASAKEQKPQDVLGTAEERANLGKGAYSGYEFAGPYDYPSRPSGRRDTALTAVGGWRSKTGEHSASLWKSTLTAKGTPAKRDNYFKWSTKGGGNWTHLNSKDAMRVFTKMDARRQGQRMLAQPNPGQELTHLMSSTLKRKVRDIQMGKAGNERMNKRKKGNDSSNNFQVQK